MKTMTQSDPVYIHAMGAICSLGEQLATIESNLFSARSVGEYLSFDSHWSERYRVPVGDVKARLPSIDKKLFDSRNNRLALAALEPILMQVEQAKVRYGKHRVGVVVGTSTSGIAESEASMASFNKTGFHLESYSYHTQELTAPAQYLSELLDISGPAWTVSTACTSGSKAIAMGARLIKLGVCDVVVTGGVDSLCRMTIEGFGSLGVTSAQRCMPFSENRSGINIGEAAAFMMLSKEEGDVSIAAYGETSDAHHISSPHPEGRGAIAVMEQALQMAGIGAEQIDYLNFHGTATTQNDAMEARAVASVLGTDIACSSTKSLTGHTLAAAGTLEAVFSVLALQRDDGAFPPHIWDNAADPALPHMPKLGEVALGQPLKWAMSNSFAFGGNNTSLIFKRT